MLGKRRVTFTHVNAVTVWSILRERTADRDVAILAVSVGHGVRLDPIALVVRLAQHEAIIR
jgi:hypothetical protein